VFNTIKKRKFEPNYIYEAIGKKEAAFRIKMDIEDDDFSS
jgi:hypothetical protein